MGGSVPFRLIQSVGGGGRGGGWCCPLLAHSISGGGAYMLTFVIRVPYSPKEGGGGHAPPAPTLETPMTGSVGLAYLVCALQVLCKPCQW